MSSYKVDYATLYGLYNDIKSARDTIKFNYNDDNLIDSIETPTEKKLHMNIRKAC